MDIICPGLFACRNLSTHQQLKQLKRNPKMKKTNSLFLAAIVFALAGGLYSCKKDKKDGGNTNTETPKGNLKIEFEHVWTETQEFAFNTNFVQPDNKDTVNISLLRYYISNIKLKRTNGTWWSQTESYYLVDPSKTNGNMLTVKDIPQGDYTEIEYTIGVDSARNVSGAQTGVLSTTEDMFWSWNSGYIFWKCEGTSPQSPTKTFKYHIGGFSGANKAIRINRHTFNGGVLSVKTSALPQMHLMVHVSEIWNTTTKIGTLSNVQMPGSSAAELSASFAGAFEFEHIHN